jgi:hypothetical protein
MSDQGAERPPNPALVGREKIVDKFALPLNIVSDSDLIG